MTPERNKNLRRKQKRFARIVLQAKKQAVRFADSLKAANLRINEDGHVSPYSARLAATLLTAYERKYAVKGYRDFRRVGR